MVQDGVPSCASPPPLLVVESGVVARSGVGVAEGGGVLVFFGGDTKGGAVSSWDKVGEVGRGVA